MALKKYQSSLVRAAPKQAVRALKRYAIMTMRAQVATLTKKIDAFHIQGIVGAYNINPFVSYEYCGQGYLTEQCSANP